MSFLLVRYRRTYVLNNNISKFILSMVLEARDLTNFLIQLKGHCKRIMYIVLKLPVYLKQGQKLTIRTQVNVVIQSEILKVRK